ncbi:MAG: YqaJ viral recombinase family protein [Brachybacterium sp.]|uniref:YqaJ viral recombinase family nuclease n=1 Tax=Brachybacterium sp. TaxID=1891286 RepID=UPI0026473658|nr:YqaJ viral recombinase family protein [Brachybacterium sp.]MDN5687082.1 YqaJ viral recombinase family protein [Brachybacterium sp.]
MAAIARQILRADADGTPEWLAQRTEGFGGSNASELHNGKKSRFQLWREKTGHAAPEYISPELQALFDYGHSREPALAKIFTERTRWRVRNTGTWARKDHPWMLANPDRLVGSNGLLEIKTTGAYTEAAKQWRDGRVPDHAWVQAHWYAHVTGRRVLWFIAEVDRQSIILGPYDVDEDLIDDLELEAREFWELVTAGEQPAPTAPEDMPVAYPASTEGKVLEIDPWDETVTDLERLAQVQAQIKELQGEEKHLKTSIQSEMGDAEAITADGRVLVTWKSQTRKGGIDTKALADAAGLDPEDFRKKSSTSRTFLVKGA